MSVRFILGPAGSGKTHRCLEELRFLERHGRAGILLVPEQSTHSAERELLADPALPGLRHVQILSFTRLAFRLREEAGVPEPPRIGEAVRTMLLRAVLARMPDETLGPLAPLRSRQGFLEELGRFIGEVKAHGVLNFLDAARGTGPGKLRALGAVLEAYDTARRDLGLVDPEASLHGIEPLVAARAGRLRETRLFVDGFLSWTRREREVLVALARSGAPTEIALCYEDGGRAPFAPAHRTLARMREMLAAGGVAEGPPIILPAYPAGEGRFARAELARLERGLHADELAAADGAAPSAGVQGPASASPAVRPSDRPRIRVAPAPDPRREVLFWARAIDRWIRLDPRPVAPESVAVIVRTVEPYREAIREIFPAYGIPFFLDEPHRLLAHPWARLLLEGLDVLLCGWRRDAVIGFLRNPLLRCEPAAVDLLENVSLEYGRDFEDWWVAGSWEVFPPPHRARVARRDEDAAANGEYGDDDGEAFHGAEARNESDGENEDGGENEVDLQETEFFDEVEGAAGPGFPTWMTAAAPGLSTSPTGVSTAMPSAPGQALPDRFERMRATLAVVDEVRKGALLPLRRFQSAWEADNPDGAGAAARLRALESELLDPDRSGARARAWEDPRPEWTQRVASALGALLEEAARLWPAVPVSLEEFARAVKQGIAAARVPAVPVRFGQVMVAEVQRSRLAGIRRSIVGGLNDGVFPRTVAAESVLDERERRELEQAGLALGPSAAARQEEETWFGYVALTRASEEVVLTYSRRDAGGGGLEPSLLVEEVRRVLGESAVEPVPAGTEVLVLTELQTPAEAADRLAGYLVSRVPAAGPAAGDDQSAKAGDVHPSLAAAPDPAALPRVGARAVGREIRDDLYAGDAAAGSENGDDQLLDELFHAIDHPAAGVPASGSKRSDAPLPPHVRESRATVLAAVSERFDGIRPALDFHPAEMLPGDLLRRALPGPVFETSVSRLTEFAKCPYLGFARGVLRLRPRPLAEVTPLETGTLAHAALDAFFRRPRVTSAADIATTLAEVFDRLCGRPEFRAFAVDRAGEYRWDSTRRSLDRFLRVETVRMQGSAYQPVALEAGFNSRDGNAVAIPLGRDRTLLLAGRIDRIDTRRLGEETLCVVIDYKRSARGGVPKDVARGLDLQLVGYLLFTRQVMKWTPVGGLYLPVLPPPVAEEKLKRGEPNSLGIRAAGLFLARERDGIDGGVGLLVKPSRQTEQALADQGALDTIVEKGRAFLASYAASLLTGWIPARPLELKPGQLPCVNCDFGALCRFRADRDPVRREPVEGMPVPPAFVEAGRPALLAEDSLASSPVEAGHPPTPGEPAGASPPAERGHP
jgi:ATP-dependent helicase/DNAse subunit B